MIYEGDDVHEGDDILGKGRETENDELNYCRRIFLPTWVPPPHLNQGGWPP